MSLHYSRFLASDALMTYLVWIDKRLNSSERYNVDINYEMTKLIAHKALS